MANDDGFWPPEVLATFAELEKCLDDPFGEMRRREDARKAAQAQRAWEQAERQVAERRAAKRRERAEAKRAVALERSRMLVAEHTIDPLVWPRLLVTRQGRGKVEAVTFLLGEGIPQQHKNVSLGTMAKATGLTGRYYSLIRRGRYAPHGQRWGFCSGTPPPPPISPPSCLTCPEPAQGLDTHP